MAGLLPTAASAVEFSVGIGLSDGSDNPSLQHDYARLQQDIRALRTLERQLGRLGGQQPPSGLRDDEITEWAEQSEWLSHQAGEVAGLAGEVEEYLQNFRHGSTGAELFDYQAAKYKSVQRLDSIGDAAKKYALEGKAALERQHSAVKLIARTY